ncbi:hypothetical protein SLA2020_003390 [Shorea laevis]
MESGDPKGTSSDLKAHQEATFGEGKHVTSNKKLSSSSLSSSSSSSSKNHFELDVKQASNSIPGAVSKQPDDGSAIQHPPTQVMERLGESSPLSSGPSYRIPSHIFESNTNAPTEWSAASNESLFSIHMGNMSFTGDQLTYSYKSGELSVPGDSYSSPLKDVSNQSPQPKPTEISSKSSNLNGGSTTSFVKDKEEDDRRQAEFCLKDSYNIGSSSQHSDTSVKSFAFPILAGGDSSGSVRPGLKHQQSQPSTPKVATVTQSKPATPNLQSPKEQTPKAPQNAGQPKWFSCFPCCP